VNLKKKGKELPGRDSEDFKFEASPLIKRD
jgi:hypothetical protein